MTNSELASKVYESLEKRCEDFGDHSSWCKYLEANDIRPRDYDDPVDAADDLMDLANDGTDHILCYDPFPDVVKQIGGYQFLMVPKELAKKLVVLGAP